MNKEAIELKLSQMKFSFDENKPTIYAVGGLVLLGGAIVSAVWAGWKLRPEIEQHAIALDDIQHDEYADKQKDMLRQWARFGVRTGALLAAPVALATTGCTLVWRGHLIEVERLQGMAALVQALERAIANRDENAGKLIEDHTHEYEVDPEYDPLGMAKDGAIELDGDLNPYERWIGPGSPVWADHLDQSDVAVKGLEEYYTDKLNAYGYVFLNEVYERLGYEPIPEGQLIGWSLKHKNNDGKVHLNLMRGPDQFDENGCPYKTWFADIRPDGVIYNFLNEE